MITKKLLPIFGILIITSIPSGDGHALRSQTVSDPVVRLGDGTMPNDSIRQLSDIFVNGDRLSYSGYEMVRQKKKVNYKYPDESGKMNSEIIEVSDAVLKKGGQTLATFEGLYFGLGNATDFGLFPLLGGNRKQLIVSQTIPRGGRHWVAELSPEYRLLFDSGDYGVGREEFSVIDVDSDGVLEISLPVTAFYSMQDSMGMSEIPLPEILFKYDQKVQKYVPANALLQDYALRGIEDDIKNLDPEESSNYLSKRLEILLRYVYAGKKAEGWSWFEREYRLANKGEIRARIEAILKNEAVFNYIYQRRAT